MVLNNMVVNSMVVKIRRYALLFLFLLPFAAAAQGDPVTPGDPVRVDIMDGRPVELVYESAGSEIISVVARSLEDPEELDTILEVFDPDGNSIADNDDHATDRMDLQQSDSLISELELSDPGEYIIVVDTFSGVGGGSVEVLLTLASTEDPEPTDTPGNDTLDNGTLEGSVERGGVFSVDFDAAAGELLTITVRGLDGFDPRIALLNSKGRVEAENDDHGTANSTIGQFDSMIVDFPITAEGTYTLEVSGYNSMAGDFAIELSRTNGNDEPGVLPFDEPLVETFEETINDNDIFVQMLQAEAGDVYTVSVRSMSEDFDPTVAVYDPNDTLFGYNDDHGNPDAPLARFDSQIERMIIQEPGTYSVEVSGYQGGGGSFELTFERIAQNVPAGPGAEDVYVGDLPSASDVFEQTFAAEAGDWVSVSVRGLSSAFDPYITVIAPDGSLLAQNEDHSTRSFTLAFIDSFIPNLAILEDGEYTVEVSTTGRTAGSFAITISILR